MEKVIQAIMNIATDKHVDYNSKKIAIEAILKAWEIQNVSVYTGG